MQRPRRTMSHLQPRACEGVCGNNVGCRPLCRHGAAMAPRPEAAHL
jgi:hypothetical protein